MTEASPERPYWEEAFFTALAQSGFIKRSAKAAGITTGAIYNRRKKDPAFEARLQAAICDAQGGVDLPVTGPSAAATPLQWRSAFLHALAETSNVSASAERAGVKPRVVYELRRENADFAARWRAALYEGYMNLEMEVLGYLRDKDPERKMDVASALRLLAAHKESVAREEAQRANVSAADVRASLARKVEALRQQVLAERKAQKAEGK